MDTTEVRTTFHVPLGQTIVAATAWEDGDAVRLMLMSSHAPGAVAPGDERQRGK